MRKKTTTNYFLHNNVRLVQGGREYFDLLKKLIDEAQEVIHLQVYIFDEDETGRMIANALMEAAKRGVQVYVLLDAYGSQGLSKIFVNTIRANGVFLRRFQPILKGKSFYLGRRLHHKVVVVDGYKGIVAGLNISNRYNDMPGAPAWLDWGLYAEGEVGAALEEICRARMQKRFRNVAARHPRLFKDSGFPVRIRVNDWVRRKWQIYRTYLEIFRDARERISIMSAYFLPGRLFRKQIEAARKRGVRVRVVLTADADIALIKYAERYIYQWLFKHDIEVYEYKKSVVHGKMAVCDGKWMTVGSYNVNNLSAYASIELNLDVNHPEFVGEVERRIDKLVEEDCTRITEKKFVKKYNSLNFFVHRAAYEIFRLLFFISTRQRGD